ncbi:MAG: hypothetical protein V4697_03400 [Patescibacteria group bacterium]
MKRHLRVFAAMMIVLAGLVSTHSTSAQTPPSIIVEAPFEGNVYALNSLVPVVWVQDHSSTVVDVVLVRNGVDYHKVYASSGAGMNYFSLDTNELELPEADDYQIQICDDAIEVAPDVRYCSPASETFTLTDDVIPAITITAPLTNATYHSVNPLLIAWNQNYASSAVQATLYGNGTQYDLGTYTGVNGSNYTIRNIAGLNLPAGSYNLEVCDPALVDPNQPPTKSVCGQLWTINITTAAPTPIGLTLVRSGTSGAVNAQSTNCLSTCSLTVNSGAPISIVATPSGISSIFTEWTSGCSGTNRVCILSLTSTTTVTALFSPAFMANVQKNGTGTGLVTGDAGINCGSICAGRSALGGSITLTATANSGSTFIGWSGQGCSGTGTCTITSTTTGIKSVTATFSAN